MNFQFIRQGTRHSVHTTVGNGLTHVQVAEKPATYQVVDSKGAVISTGFSTRRAAERSFPPSVADEFKVLPC